jgi:hypothetical protein
MAHPKQFGCQIGASKKIDRSSSQMNNLWVSCYQPVNLVDLLGIFLWIGSTFQESEFDLSGIKNSWKPLPAWLPESVTRARFLTFFFI